MIIGLITLYDRNTTLLIQKIIYH